MTAGTAPQQQHPRAVPNDVHRLLGRFRKASFGRKATASRLFVERPAAQGGGFVMGASEAAAAIHAGISAAAVHVLDAVPVEKWKWLASIGIDKSTLSRRIAQSKPLEPAHAEGVLRAMELAMLATETFGTTTRAAGWLGAAHPLLGGLSPLEYANSSYGLARIKSILASIRFGGVV